MKTAVEWLRNQIEEDSDTTFHNLNWDRFDELIEQAKEMEKEQIIESYSSGYTDSSNEYRFNREYYSTKYTLKSE
jgi:hypothetical protein